jgi:hypothetical protein
MLQHPSGIRAARAGQVLDPAAAYGEEDKQAEAAQPDRVDGEEVTGEDPHAPAGTCATIVGRASGKTASRSASRNTIPYAQPDASETRFVKWLNKAREAG